MNIADEQKMQTMLIETFNTVSSGYDGSALSVFPQSAAHLASLLNLRGDEHVLDVACGTGHASLAISPLIPKGQVIGVDFSAGMLDQARRKTRERGIENIEFIEQDMQHLEFGNRYDVAVCAFGIFFVMDMEKQLAHIASAVKPGGRIMITSWFENFFQPLRERLFTRLSAFNVQGPPQAWERVASEEGCRQLFARAALQDIRVERKNIGYYLNTTEEWWDIVWNAGFRRYITQLSALDQEQFKHDHLREIKALGTAKGIWLDAEVLYTMGTTSVADESNQDSGH